MMEKEAGQTRWRFDQIKGSIAPVIMLAGIAMMAFGIMRGEMSVVFMKAVNICLECIGIG